MITSQNKLTGQVVLKNNKSKLQEGLSIVFSILGQILISGFFVIVAGLFMIIFFGAFSLYWVLLKLKFVK